MASTGDIGRPDTGGVGGTTGGAGATAAGDLSSAGATGVGAASGRDYGDSWREAELVERRTETRRSPSTSEFWIFVILSVVILFFTYESGNDSLSREEGWRFVTGLAIAYMISRGLAKAASLERYMRRRGEDY